MKCGTCKMNTTLMVVHGLLREIPAATIVFKSMDGHTPYTAADMMKEIEQQSDLGLTWASDLLRISRNFLIDKASQPEQANEGTGP